MPQGGSLANYAFIFGNREDQLLLALAVLLEERPDEPEVTAGDLLGRLWSGRALHPNVDVQFESQRQLTLALGRLRRRGLVTSRPRDPFGGDRTLVWDLTERGWTAMADSCLVKPTRK